MSSDPIDIPVVVEKKKRVSKKSKKASNRKPTHWMMLVKAIYAAKDTKGATGLTDAMQQGQKLLPSFKVKFPDGVPTLELAVAWLKKESEVPAAM